MLSTAVLLLAFSNYFLVQAVHEIDINLHRQFFKDFLSFYQKSIILVLADSQQSSESDDSRLQNFLDLTKALNANSNSVQDGLEVQSAEATPVIYTRPEIEELSPMNIYLIPNELSDWLVPSLNQEVVIFSLTNNGSSSLDLKEVYYLKSKEYYSMFLACSKILYIHLIVCIFLFPLTL